MSPRRTNRALPLQAHGTHLYSFQNVIFIYCLQRVPQDLHILKMDLDLFVEDDDVIFNECCTLSYCSHTLLYTVNWNISNSNCQWSKMSPLSRTSPLIMLLSAMLCMIKIGNCRHSSV
jgi:hypothetical protein